MCFIVKKKKGILQGHYLQVHSFQDDSVLHQVEIYTRIKAMKRMILAGWRFRELRGGLESKQCVQDAEYIHTLSGGISVS